MAVVCLCNMLLLPVETSMAACGMQQAMRLQQQKHNCLHVRAVMAVSSKQPDTMRALPRQHFSLHLVRNATQHSTWFGAGWHRAE